jgi:predicted GNAT superfamily acetyltransferase
MGDVILRHCRGLDEFESCVDLQKAVWGYDESDIIPSRMFIVAKKIGGQIIGCFDDEQLVGFCLSIPGYRNGHSYLHSHMLAVKPEYRNHGLGRRMKLAQRDDALNRGIELMEWTFDPLEIKNAHLNINRLGAIVRRYVPNQYGAVSSELQAGLPTDRLIAEWWIKSRRVDQLLQSGSFPVCDILERVTVPAEVADWKKSRDARAGETQGELREKLLGFLGQGLSILQYRVLDDGSGEFGLGIWDEEWSYGPAPDQVA